MALSKREAFLATVLAAIAITAIAYAHLLTGAITITITPQDIVTVYPVTIYIPKLVGSGGMFNRTTGDVIVLGNFNAAGFSTGDKILVRVELLPDAQAYALKALYIKLINATNGSSGEKVAELTLNNPYDEFVVSVPSSETKNYKAQIAVAAGPEVGGQNLQIRLSVSITGWP
jgi:hypothetical protein